MLPVSKSGRLVMAAAGLWGYVIFIGAPVSAQRAVLFWSMIMAAWRARRLVSLPTCLAVALLAVTTWQPAAWGDVGLQLSFAAVMGIFLVLFLTRSWRKSREGSWTGKVLPGVLAAAGATAATWPLSAYYFAAVPLLGVAANVLVVPAVPLFMLSGLTASGLGLIFPLAGRAVAWLTHELAAWIIGTAEIASTMPGVVWKEAQMSVWMVLAYYAVMLVGAHYLLMRQRRSWREIWE
jgi:competence protein ComEC